MYHKKIYICFYVLLLSNILLSQGICSPTVVGKIINERNIGVPNVKIIILSMTNHIMAEAYTNIDGDYFFYIKPGQYKLIAYDSNFRDEMTITLPISSQSKYVPITYKTKISTKIFSTTLSIFLNIFFGFAAGIFSAVILLKIKKRKSWKVFLKVLKQPLEEAYEDLNLFINEYKDMDGGYLVNSENEKEIIEKFKYHIESILEKIEQNHKYYGQLFIVNLPDEYNQILQIEREIKKTYDFTHDTDWIISNDKKNLLANRLISIGVKISNLSQ